MRGSSRACIRLPLSVRLGQVCEPVSVGLCRNSFDIPVLFACCKRSHLKGPSLKPRPPSLPRVLVEVWGTGMGGLC